MTTENGKNLQENFKKVLRSRTNCLVFSCVRKSDEVQVRHFKDTENDTAEQLRHFCCNWGSQWNVWTFPLLWHFAILLKKFSRINSRKQSKMHETYSNRKKKKSRFCLELLIGEIITILLFCKIVLFASFSSHFSRHCSWVRLRRRQNFPCDSAWHPAVLFPLQSCQTLSAVWKKKKKCSGGFPIITQGPHKNVRISFVSICLMGASSAGGHRHSPWPPSLQGLPPVDRSPSLCTKPLLPMEELGYHSFFFPYPFVCF